MAESNNPVLVKANDQYDNNLTYTLKSIIGLMIYYARQSFRLVSLWKHNRNAE